MPKLIRAGLLICCSSCRDVDQVFIFLPTCGPPPAVFSVGDTGKLFADAHSRQAGLFGTILYSADGRPGAFSWRVVPDSVAAVVPGPRLVLRRPGAARLIATTSGVSAETTFEVRSRKTEIHVRIPPQARVGDTIPIRFEARDSAGPFVPAVHPNVVPEGSPTRAFFMKSTVEGEVRAVALAAGRVTARWCYAQRLGRLEFDVQ